MNDEKKEALLEQILKAIGADPGDVVKIKVQIEYEPSKTAKEKPKQG